MKGIFQILQPAPFVDTIEDEDLIKKRYRHWRVRMFLSIYLGYVVFYFTRRSFVSVLPIVGKEFGWDNTSLGLMATVMAVTYGISKFISGLMGDKSNARYFMAIGLVLTGIINIIFGFNSTLLAFAILWGLNGWFQGWGMPPSAKTMMHWFSKSERGTWWSVWSTAHNIGAMFIPIIAAWAAFHFGWRYGMYVPGVIAIIVGLALIYTMRDTPQSLGLPSIEEFKNEYESSKKGKKAKSELSYKEILFRYVFPNKYIWMLAIAYAFVYIVRAGVSDWIPKYLVDKGFDYQVSVQTTSFFEIAGIIGMLMTGWCSDFFFRGRRAPLNVMFALLVSLPIVGLLFTGSSSLFVDYVLVFISGFFIYGPQMLIGLNAAELAHKNAAATAVGFVGLFAYLGAALAGAPLGWVIDNLGWNGFFIVLISSSLIATVMLLPTLSSQKRQVKKNKAIKKDDGKSGSSEAA